MMLDDDGNVCISPRPAEPHASHSLWLRRVRPRRLSVSPLPTQLSALPTFREHMRRPAPESHAHATLTPAAHACATLTPRLRHACARDARIPL
eukprot:6006350-Pleurochrysis_carterae.AAC.3